MDLNRLRCAVAVAEHGSFTSAARHLHISQPALSYAIAKLEAEFGVALFHRQGRRTTLTAAGEAFLPVARDTLRDVDRVHATMAEIAGVVSGRLEVATPRTLVRRMAALVGRFRERHPAVVVQLDDAEGDDAVLDALRSGRCELGLLRGSDVPADLQGDSVAPAEFVAVFPEGTRLTRRRAITLADLAAHPLVGPPRGTVNRAVFEGVFATRGLSIVIAAESAHPESLLELVWAGAGASLASADQATSFIARGAIVRSLDPPIVQPVHLVARAGRLSPAAAAFRQLAVK